MDSEQQSGFRTTKWIQNNKVDSEQQSGFRKTKWIQKNKVDSEQQNGFQDKSGFRSFRMTQFRTFSVVSQPSFFPNPWSKKIKKLYILLCMGCKLS
jgi:hypothetical protein